MVGTTIGHYRVLALLGRGGMGEVYAAEDLKLRRRVALKVLPPDMESNAERRRRFEREAQAVAALNHPGIVTIYSVEREDGVAFLTMELVEGRTLADSIPEKGLALPDLVRIAASLADAVYAAHERGILHRDLKPANVMLTPEGRVKVLDFGLAKQADAEPVAAAPGLLTTGAGQIVGTLAYMAPEQAEGKTVDHRADLFALGVLLYELACGVRPFPGETNVSILTGLMRDTPPPVTSVRPDLPPAFDAIVQKCLEKDPARRYQSAAELRADLERLPAPRAPASRPATPGWAYAAAAVIVLLTGAAGWWTLGGSPPDPIAEFAGAPAGADVPVLITGDMVAILDFANRSGDTTLDAYGRMVSEGVATALAAQGVPIVSATEASAGDGLTLAAAYDADGGLVRFQARILAASRGTVLKTLDPVQVPRADLAAAAHVAQSRVVTAVMAARPMAPRLP